MKNKEWLKEEINSELMVYSGNPIMSSYDYGRVSGLNCAFKLIDQLEEPEQDIDTVHDLLAKITTLSQEDFDLYWNCINDGVAIRDLEQEKVVIPQFVADFIEEVKPNFNIRAVFTLENDKHEQGQEWALNNPDVFAIAWLDGYTVEKEKRYTACFAPIGTRQGVYLYRESGSVKVGDNMKVYDKSKQEYHLTEQEIRNRDERFWDFAEEVTK